MGTARRYSRQSRALCFCLVAKRRDDTARHRQNRQSVCTRVNGEDVGDDAVELKIQGSDTGANAGRSRKCIHWPGTPDGYWRQRFLGIAG